MSTPVLALDVVEVADGGNDLRSYPTRVDFDQKLNAVLDSVDAFAGHVTASFSTRFHLTGSASDALGDGGLVGAAYSRDNRLITEVVAWAETSGSGGVTVLDVQKQLGAGLAFASIFTGSATVRPRVSSSLGDFGLDKRSAFASGSVPVWQAGTLLRVQMLEAAGDVGESGQKGLTVEIFWKPSGSYGV